ncbi:hypothetical protein AG1IA_09029 [Rhizoctonia solani AG-1 IA]|uniref:Uncharacterized protein n=1 Tax=Thanatephorus cucumeris (strain AG1-IA) TaxID=983506 RepID=L8WFJ1_THACA|nr:hypothetical protein AG1IA_09029 [Rhizoctonia solani AG-1 IA]
MVTGLARRYIIPLDPRSLRQFTLPHMAYYDYYRRRNPTSWGRPEYILDSPPAPGYQPQPQCSAFDSVLGRIRSHFRSPISRRDAQTWHQRVYSGLVDVATMTPAEIGAAAGYEAWRFWEHHRGIYRQPLMDDHERETEALVGLAVGEGVYKLWDYTRRHRGDFSKREALEVAAGKQFYHIFPSPINMLRSRGNETLPTLPHGRALSKLSPPSSPRIVHFPRRILRRPRFERL